MSSLIFMVIIFMIFGIMNSLKQQDIERRKRLQRLERMAGEKNKPQPPILEPQAYLHESVKKATSVPYKEAEILEPKSKRVAVNSLSSENTPNYAKPPRGEFLEDFQVTENDLVQGVIWSEILGRPRALRPFRGSRA